MIIDKLAQDKKMTRIAIFIVWLVHISAVIGIFMGYHEWFITKTPMNLLLLMLVLVFFNPLTSMRALGIFAMVFSFGFLSEVIGVNTGLLFGDYRYGGNLGWKIAGVPLLIGVNWAVLVVVSAEILRSFNFPVWLKAALAAGLMVLLDAFIEPLAPGLDFWHWTYGHPPAFNYITWFVIAFVLIWFYNVKTKKGNVVMAWHIYLSQLFFFCLLNLERIL